MKHYNIMCFGAVGDGITDDAGPIQSAIDACSREGGGIVLVPSGHVFLAGPFDFKSHVELRVEAGAVILANPDESVYTESAFRENRSEGTIWIGGKYARQISITGKGIIDGNGPAFMDGESKYAYNLKPVTDFDPRPHLMTLIGCSNITIRDVTFRNAAYWCLHPVGCEDIVIEGIRILNDLKIRNCDGIDPDHCRNVRISNCHIESGDDCICLKNRREYAEFGACESITVIGCTLISTSCAIKLGSENVDAIRNAVFDSIVISSSNRGIGIQHRDEGIVEDIIFTNISINGRLFDDVWWGKAEPIYITAFNRNLDAMKRFPEDGIQKNVGQVKNIQFRNIFCKSENGVYISGSRHSPPEEILLENVRVEINKWSSHRGGRYDRRPCDVEGIIENRVAGFLLNDSGEISLRNCKVLWGPVRPDYYGHAVEASGVRDLRIDNFKGEAAFPENDQPVKIINERR